MKRVISKIIVIPSITVPLLGVSACQQANKTFVLQNLEYDDKDMTYFIAQQAEDKTQKLYAVDNEISEIREVQSYFVYDGDKTQTRHKETISPKFLYQISDQYYFLGFNDKPIKEGTHVQTPNYLVDRISGECFPFPTYSVPVFDLNEYRTHYDGCWLNFPQDKQGNIYYVASELDKNGNIYHPLNKLNILNPNKIVITKISQENDSVDGSFAVDIDGNCIYSIKDEKGDYAYKCINSNLEICLNNILGNSEFFSCPNGNIYMCTTEKQYQNKVCRILFTGKMTHIVEDKQLALDPGAVYIGLGTFSHIFAFTNEQTYIEPFVIAIASAPGWKDNWVLQLYNGTESEGEKPLKGWCFSGFSDTPSKFACASSKYFYVWGNNVADPDKYRTFCNGQPTNGVLGSIPVDNKTYHCENMYDVSVDFEGEATPTSIYQTSWLVYSIHNSDGTSCLGCINKQHKHHLLSNVFIGDITNLTDAYSKEN